MSETTSTSPSPIGFTFGLGVPFEGKIYSFSGYSTYWWSKIDLPYSVSLSNATADQLKGPHIFSVVIDGPKVILNLRNNGPIITLTFEEAGVELPPVGNHGEGFGVWFSGATELPGGIPVPEMSASGGGKDYSAIFDIKGRTHYPVKGNFFDPVPDFSTEWINPTSHANTYDTIILPQEFHAEFQDITLTIGFERGLKAKAKLSKSIGKETIAVVGFWPGWGFGRPDEGANN